MKQGILLFLLFPFLLTAQRPKNYDLLNLKANITIFPYQKEVKGQLQYTLKLLKYTDSIVFDAPGINTIKVTNGCIKLPFKQTGKYLIIYKKFKPEKKYKLKLAYVAHPKQAMYFTGWHEGGRKQVWTQGQGKDNTHWLPGNANQNDKFTWTLQVNFDKNYRVISNGTLIKKKTYHDSLVSYVFRQDLPAPNYLIFIGAGKYVESKIDTKQKTPVFNYQYPDKLLHDKTYYKTAFIFDRLVKEIGVKYPWKNYKQVPCRDFLYGGMENVSATSFNGDRYVVDSIAFNDVNFVNVSAHELAHQWFGDLVTGKSSADHWLHEGFATYYARRIDRQIFGESYTQYRTYLYDRQIISGQNTDTIPLHRPNASSLTYYQKGARILEMIRYKIGDSLFNRTIKTYLRNFAFKNADIHDFKKILERTSRQNFDRFFNIWFEHTTIPSFELRQKDDSIIFKKNSHHLPLDFLIITKHNKFIVKHKQNFKIKNLNTILTIIPNPGNYNLYDIKFTRSKKWLKNQILYSPDFIDRYTALLQANKWSEKEKDTLYGALIKRQDYFPVYAVIINQIKKTLTDQHLAFLQLLFKKDLKTRQQIAIQLSQIPPQLKKPYFSLIDDASYQTKQAVLWHYWQNFPAERSFLLDYTKKIKGSNDYSFRLTWLSLALLTQDYRNNQKSMIVRELINYTSPSYNMQVRLNAFKMLMELKLINETVVQNLIQAAFHFNWRLHSIARQYLKTLYQLPAYRSFIENSLQNLPASRKRILIKSLV